MPNSSNDFFYSIRPCTLDDLDAVREICIETSSMPLNNEKDRQLLLNLFCNPYVEFSPDCFVAVDENNRAIGYILCGINTLRFFRTFKKKTLPKIKDLGIKYLLTARGIIILHEMCVVFAPAHLHIDLTESARRKGIGTALMNTLTEHLKKQGIKRVQLICGSENRPAIEFYKRNGFKTVFRGFGSSVMRRKIK